MALTKTLSLNLPAAVANGIAQSQSLGSAGNLTLNGSLVSGGIASLVTAQRVFITSAANDSGLTWTVTGTDRYGRAQTEALAGGNAVAVSTQHDFLTVTRIAGSGATAGAVTAGTGTIGSTDPWIVDEWANPPKFGGAAETVGAAFVLEGSYDDFSPQWDINTNTPTWFPVYDGSAASTGDFNFSGVYTMLRLTNKAAGAVIVKLRQAYAGRTT